MIKGLIWLYKKLHGIVARDCGSIPHITRSVNAVRTGFNFIRSQTFGQNHNTLLQKQSFTMKQHNKILLFEITLKKLLKIFN